jgi:hypothetical protein
MSVVGSYCLRIKFNLPPIFVNKVLLGHSHGHPLIYVLSVAVPTGQQSPCAHKA